MSTSELLIATSLLFAGTVKGMFGMGLPTVSVGLLGLFMAPADAATLIVIPTLVTNAWQFLTGGKCIAMVKRFATLLLGIVVGTVVGVGFLTGANPMLVSLALGTVLLLYAAVGLLAARWSVPTTSQPWASPLIGLLSGVVNGATAVSVVPLVPYLNSIGLQRDALIQAMGLAFMTAMLALAACLAWSGHLHMGSAGTSLLALVPVFAGMYAGQAIRVHLTARVFRQLFFVGLIALGGYLAIRALLQLQ